MIFRTEIAFVKLIIPLIAGIILAYNFQNEQLATYTQWLVTLLFITLLCINIGFKNISGWKYRLHIASIYYALTLLVGAFLVYKHSDLLKVDYYANNSYKQLKLVIDNEPQQTNDILRFEALVTQGYIANKAHATTGKLLVALKVDSLQPIALNYGDVILVNANYQLVEPPYNPKEFDFKSWLAAKNIYQQTFINQGELRKVDTGQGNPVVAFALSFRQKQINYYRKVIKDDEAFAVASTLILGYRADLSQETLSAYSKTGTIHALSVSGMHVGIIYVMLNWLLSWLDKWKYTRLFKTVFLCIFIWAYALLTGFSPSVLRSAIMLTIFIISKSIKRNTNGFNILAFTAFCLLVYNPFLIWDVGFQLSFLAVYGLVFLHPKIYKWLYFKHKAVDMLWSTVSLSLAAQLTTLPLSVYYFHQFPVYFIISNLFILIPITVLMYLGILILLVKVSFLAVPFEFVIIWMNKGLKWIAELPFAGVTRIWLTPLQLTFFALFVLLLIYGLSFYKKKLLYAALVALLVFQGASSIENISAFSQRKIIFFTLRKNYAAAFIDGKSAVLLTDLEDSEKSLAFFVKPALDQLQIGAIKTISLADTFKTAHFTKLKNQISFYNKTFLLLDSNFKFKKIANLPQYNYVWLRNSVNYSVAQLKDEVKFEALILDASNKDYILKQFNTDAQLLNVKTHTLKRNNHLAINLKP